MWFQALWEAHVVGNKVVFSYLSKCGEEGYPGHVLVQATYQLSSSNELILSMSATSTKPTPVNLTNHSYFNLAGHVSCCFSETDVITTTITTTTTTTTTTTKMMMMIIIIIVIIIISKVYSAHFIL